MLSGTWLGVDMGGTRTKAVVLTGGEVVDRGSDPTVRGTAPDTVAGLVATVTAWVGRHPGVRGVGITIPGHFDAEGRAVVLPNLPGTWPGQPITQPVRDAVGRSVHLINDARGFGLAELTLGAARGARTAVGVVLGTGIGGFVAVDGRLHLGAAGGAGEIGHQVVVPGGPPCGCGNAGCVEALARADVVAAAAGHPTVEDAVASARAGDARALAALKAAGHHLGHGLANVVTVLQPEVVVVGGGVAAAGDLLLGPLTTELARLTPLVPAASYRVAVGALGPWAGAVGAALAVSDAAT